MEGSRKMERIALAQWHYLEPNFYAVNESLDNLQKVSEPQLVKMSSPWKNEKRTMHPLRWPQGIIYKMKLIQWKWFTNQYLWRSQESVSSQINCNISCFGTWPFLRGGMGENFKFVNEFVSSMLSGHNAHRESDMSTFYKINCFRVSLSFSLYLNYNQEWFYDWSVLIKFLLRP